MKNKAYYVMILCLTLATMNAISCELSSDQSSQEQVGLKDFHFDTILDMCLGANSLHEELPVQMGQNCATKSSWYQSYLSRIQRLGVGLFCRYCRVRQWIMQRMSQVPEQRMVQ